MNERMLIETIEADIPAGEVMLEGDLAMCERCSGLVIFAHGSGSGKNSPRNRFVSDRLGSVRLATMLVDLLTEPEQQEDMLTAELRFNIPLLGQRVAAVIAWARTERLVRDLPLGLYGASTGAAAALVAAAEMPESVGAVVSRGGRPDLAMEALGKVRAATLLIVGGNDLTVLELNNQAMQHLRCVKQLEIVPGASHLFAEAHALDQVAMLTTNWFAEHLCRP